MKITSEMLREIAAMPEAARVAALLFVANQVDAAESRRGKDRERKRKSRGSHAEVTGNSADTARNSADTSPLKEIPPTPPKENNPPALSEANASSSEPRAGTTSEPMARLEFDSEFWPRYPNKVGKPKALDAYIAARRKATLPEILDGLARYKSDKPPDRQWLNPATFLHEERWNDDPAPAPSRQQSSKPEPAHDAIFRALAVVASGGHGGGEWASDPDGRLLDYRGGSPPA